jgi:hypothetical protein
MSLESLLKRARDRIATKVWSHYGAARYRSAFRSVQTYCAFVGYPRSGHSLFGSLLDAHPDCVIAHELDAIKFLYAGLTRDQLFALITKRSRDFADRGSRWNEFDYSVPGQWQGRFRELRVIGDKKGGLTALQVRRDPNILARLQSLVRVPVKVIHVVRNPYDNVATMLRRDKQGFGELAAYARRYAEHCEGTQIALAWAGERALTLKHEDFVAEPRALLGQACTFLGVDAPGSFLEACASRVRSSPNLTRKSGEWSEPVLDSIRETISRHEFLQEYDVV